MIKVIVSLVATFALVSCGGNVKQSGSKYPCSGVDWAVLGYDTAVAGKPVRFFDRYKSSCGTRLEAGALTQYQDGYVKGVVVFCTFDKGYELGAENKKLPEVCPFELSQNIKKGYGEGQRYREDVIKKLKRSTESLEGGGVGQPSPDTGVNGF